ncbi:MAG: hypothetical protein MJB14_16335 [Spirochaetes bacterium]|nr:hypothetical protein [Spirochaetota bacterium]
MKKKCFFLLFIFFLSSLNALEGVKNSRIYIFRIISFHKKYELYCSLEPCGYYKYPVYFYDATIYLTYETQQFYQHCLFDENCLFYTKLYPSTMWTNSRGEMFRLKQGYAPVIDLDKTHTGHPYGYARDYQQ